MPRKKDTDQSLGSLLSYLSCVIFLMVLINISKKCRNNTTFRIDRGCHLSNNFVPEVCELICPVNAAVPNEAA
jgi:hypothetical protein